MKLSMKLIYLFLQAVVPFFATDFDKTIVHYPKDNDTIAAIDAQNFQLVHLPASATGLKGVLATETVDLINQIATKTTVICASGMRESTMRSRQPYLPAVKYWVCENGGRIFETQCNGQLKLLPEWVDYIEKESMKEDNSIMSLQKFKAFVKDNMSDIKIDNAGYETMVRLKGVPERLKHVITKLPKNLKYTFNLGHLDVQLPCCGKYEAIHWLSYYLQNKTTCRHHGGIRLWCTQMQRFISNLRWSDQDAKTACKEKSVMVHKKSYSLQLPDLPYIYMGDDDNDIPAAEHAILALIANKHSTAMKSWIRRKLMRPESSMKKGQSVGNLVNRWRRKLLGHSKEDTMEEAYSQSPSLAEDLIVNITKPETNQSIFVSRYPYHTGTVKLLTYALNSIQ